MKQDTRSSIFYKSRIINCCLDNKKVNLSFSYLFTFHNLEFKQNKKLNWAEYRTKEMAIASQAHIFRLNTIIFPAIFKSQRLRRRLSKNAWQLEIIKMSISFYFFHLSTLHSIYIVQYTYKLSLYNVQYTSYHHTYIVHIIHMYIYVCIYCYYFNPHERGILVYMSSILITQAAIFFIFS